MKSNQVHIASTKSGYTKIYNDKIEYDDNYFKSSYNKKPKSQEFYYT